MSGSQAAIQRLGQALLGRTRQFDLGVMDARWSQRYAVAIDDLDPVYFDPAHAVSRGYSGMLVPPNFVATQRASAGPGPSEAEMQEDGLARVTDADEPALHAMGGGQELLFHAPILVGEHIRAEASIRRADLRNGRAGAMLVVEEEIAYRSDGGEPKVTLIQTTLYRLAGEAPDAG